MSVRITFRGPQVDKGEDQPGKYQQQNFPDLTQAVEWISHHIPKEDRLIIKMWIDDLPITGDSLALLLPN